MPPLNGVRKIENWELLYNGWLSGEVRDYAVFVKLKLASRRGSLVDVETLRKLGLTVKQLKNDPLLFYQLLFPFCDPKSQEWWMTIGCHIIVGNNMPQCLQGITEKWILS